MREVERLRAMNDAEIGHLGTEIEELVNDTYFHARTVTRSALRGALMRLLFCLARDSAYDEMMAAHSATDQD